IVSEQRQRIEACAYHPQSCPYWIVCTFCRLVAYLTDQQRLRTIRDHAKNRLRALLHTRQRTNRLNRRFRLTCGKRLPLCGENGFRNHVHLVPVNSEHLDFITKLRFGPASGFGIVSWKNAIIAVSLLSCEDYDIGIVARRGTQDRGTR